jgi:hypothetical protein
LIFLFFRELSSFDYRVSSFDTSIVTAKRASKTEFDEMVLPSYYSKRIKLNKLTSSPSPYSLPLREGRIYEVPSPLVGER